MAEYIEKEACLALIEDKIWRENDTHNLARLEAAQELKGDVMSLPAADVRENVKAHWIPVTNGRGGCECSSCHAYAPSYQSGDEYTSPFCPNCGAKMEVQDG